MAALAPLDVSQVVTALGVVVGATSLVVGVINARRDQHAKRMEREAAVLQAMNARFQEMAAARRALSARTKADEPVAWDETYSFYAQYWALQIDQWEHYRLGVISRDVYVTWLCYLYDTLSAFHRIGTLDSRESWTRIGRSLSRNNVEFRLIAEQLHERASVSGGRASQMQNRLRLRHEIGEVLDTTPKWIRGTRLSARQRRFIELEVQE